MKIRKIKIKNYKIFDDLELDFTDSDGKALDTIVLAGINGCGKTSILQLLQTIFSVNFNRFWNWDFLALKIDNVFCEELTIEFESSLDFIQSFNTLLISVLNELIFSPEQHTRESNIKNICPLLESVVSKLSNIEGKKGDIKIFSFCYKSQKNNEKIAVSENDFIPFGIISENITSQYFGALYFVANSFELNNDLEKKIPDEKDGIVKLVDIFSHKEEIEGYLKDSIIDAVLKNREISAQNAINKKVEEINQILKNIKINTKLIDITSEKVIFESTNGKKISIDDLSSGEKQLYYRAVMLSKLNIKDSFILVDEPETSLHPTWQREIIKLYQNAGENNQVILATHSPHIIASVNPKNLFVLYFDEKARKIKVMNMEKEQKYTKGVEPNRILAEIMGYKLRDEDTQNRIDEITLLFRQSPADIEKIEKKIELLAYDLGLHDPAIMGINNRLLLMKRKLNQ